MATWSTSIFHKKLVTKQVTAMPCTAPVTNENSPLKLSPRVMIHHFKCSFHAGNNNAAKIKGVGLHISFAAWTSPLP